MGDLVLSGVLNLTGTLKLSADGGRVKVDENEILIEQTPGNAHGQGSPVILPPPPAGPIDTGVDATIFKSFTSTVTINNNPVVTMGMYLQGNTPTWPGMVLPSSNNPGVTVNYLLINVQNDTGITLPNGAPVKLTTSRQ